MPIASVVLTLDAHPELRANAMRAMSSDARIDVGEPAAAEVVPAVIDTATAEEGEALVQSLLATPGVLRVDVVAIDFACDDGAA